MLKITFSYLGTIVPENKTLVAVLDFKFEKHTSWKAGEQVKDDYGRPVLKDVHFLRKIMVGDKIWRSDDGEYKLLKRKFEAQKEKIAEQKRRNLDKDVQYILYLLMSLSYFLFTTFQVILSNAIKNEQ